MIIQADVATGPQLSEADDFTRFHVLSSAGDSSALAHALGDAGQPADEDDHVWISMEWIRGMAPADPAWRDGFRKMVDYASSKGWLNESGTHIKAHVEPGG